MTSNIPFPGRDPDRVIEYPHFPIQQAVRSTTHSSQRAFAQDVATRLCNVRFRDAIVHADDDGVLVLGSREPALLPALSAILELSGGGIAISEPQLRRGAGTQASMPAVVIEVRVPRVYARDLLRELRSRRARIVSVKFGVFRLRVRAELSQPDSLGFPTWASATTEGRARVELRRVPLRSVAEEDPGSRRPAPRGNAARKGRPARLQLKWSSSPARLARWVLVPANERARWGKA